MGAEQEFYYRQHQDGTDDNPSLVQLPRPGGHPQDGPAAGGCSVSVMAMASMSKPTDTARLRGSEFERQFWGAAISAPRAARWGSNYRSCQ